MVYPKGKLPTGFVWGEDSGNGVNDQPDINNTKPLSVITPTICILLYRMYKR